jgi:hypothetical protein
MQTAHIQTILGKLRDLTALALASEETEADAPLYAWAMDAIIAQADEYDREMKRRSRTYFVRPDLLWPEQAPWAKLKGTRSERGYVHLLRVTPDMLDELLSYVPPEAVAWRDGYTNAARTERRPGPSNMLSSYDCLAAALFHLSSMCRSKHSELVFGVGHTLMSEAITTGLAYLEELLPRLPDAQILWPDAARFDYLGRVVANTYGEPPIPVSMGLFVDGFRLQIDNPSLAEEQTFWYSGFTKYTCCNNIVVYAADGTIVWASVNHPGSTSDYKASRELFQRCCRVGQLPPRTAICGDDAFSSAETDHFMATRGFKPPWVAITGTTRRRWEGWQKTVRQGVEWGIRTLTGTWMRLRCSLPTDVEKRKQTIMVCIRLHNLIARRMNNHNQLKTVYLDGWIRAPGAGGVAPTKGAI